MTEPIRPGTDPTADTTVQPTPAAPVAPPSAPMQPPTGPTSAPVIPEPATPVATSPVGGDATGATAQPKRNRGRWIAAIAIVTVVLVASAAAALALTAGSSAATVLGYVPTDSIVYGEARLDLPGDQEQAVGAFLSKFPGFADQAALDTKLDEVLDRLVASASQDKQTYTKDIEPWFDGELGFAVGPLPQPAAITDPESAVADSRGLLLLSVKDAALAQAWFAALLTDQQVTGTPQTYDGVELTVFSGAEMPGTQTAFGIVDDKVALVGDLASVEAAIDTDGKGGLAADPEFATASDAIEGDTIGFLFMDVAAVTASAMDVVEQGAGGTPMLAAVQGLVPDWIATGLRIEDDAVVIDSAVPHDPARPGSDTNHANGVASWAPPTTIILSAGNDVGATLDETIELFRGDADLKDVFTGLDQATGVLGGLDATIGWIGDAGVVVSQDAGTPEGGLIIIPTDPAAARQFLTTIRSFVALGGATQGIAVRDEDYGGTTITVVDLGSARDLVGLAGAMGGGVVPSDPSTLPLPEGDIELAFAVTDGVVVIGSGPDFVKSVLDAGAGQSLADEARYRDIVARVGAEHTAVQYADIAAIRGMLEGLMASAPADQRAEYDESVKPFLAPFDAYASATVVGQETDGSSVVITVK